MKTEKEWQEILPETVFAVCRKGETEAPFSGKWLDCKEQGCYVCACCQNQLFDAKHKYDSGSGWPSFWQVRQPNVIELVTDTSHNMVRTEVKCKACQAHLGHLFEDGPKPTGLRFCINSTALQFVIL